ncbi:hypothetical protein RvY_05780 [Ramazzottius varieornatus]|uniref:Uncharacterized protein n=1 Tax=Ramazzottius varieornatus TaxID=947166 RepID=A0A1D1V2V5_RAMVA|nr:hypothetical protein RvY_05780 [Ramazzottius varieornatus]
MARLPSAASCLTVFGWILQSVVYGYSQDAYSGGTAAAYGNAPSPSGGYGGGGSRYSGSSSGYGGGDYGSGASSGSGYGGGSSSGGGKGIITGYDIMTKDAKEIDYEQVRKQALLGYPILGGLYPAVGYPVIPAFFGWGWPFIYGGYGGLGPFYGAQGYGKK